MLQRIAYIMKNTTVCEHILSHIIYLAYVVKGDIHPSIF